MFVKVDTESVLRVMPLACFGKWNRDESVEIGSFGAAIEGVSLDNTSINRVYRGSRLDQDSAAISRDLSAAA